MNHIYACPDAQTSVRAFSYETMRTLPACFYVSAIAFFCHLCYNKVYCYILLRKEGML